MGRIKKILDRELVGGTTNEEIYPVSSTKAIYDSSNRNLDYILSLYLSRINELSARVGFYYCDTIASDPDKEIEVPDFQLSSKIRLLVKMNKANTANNVSFEVNNTGAKILYYNELPASRNNTWEEGEVLDIFYDGTSYQAFRSKGNGIGDSFWELKTDEFGNSFIHTKYSIATSGGATVYGGEPAIPVSIFDNIPIDNDTIYWYIDQETGDRYLKSKGGGLGDLTLITTSSGIEPSDDTIFSAARTIKEITDRLGENGLWKLVEDSKGNKYLVTEYPILTKSGITAYYEDILDPGGSGGIGGGGTILNIEVKGEGNALINAYLNEDKSILNFDRGYLMDLTTEQTSTALKTFTEGIKVGDTLIKVIDGVLTLDCSLAVTGGITAYALGEQTASSIMDAIICDNTTIAVVDGKLTVIGGTGGASNWDELEGKPSWITDTKPTYAWGEITQKPTTLSGYGIQASDVLNVLKTVDGSGSGLDADLLDGLQSNKFMRFINEFERRTNLSTQWVQIIPNGMYTRNSFLINRYINGLVATYLFNYDLYNVNYSGLIQISGGTSLPFGWYYDDGLKCYYLELPGNSNFEIMASYNKSNYESYTIVDSPSGIAYTSRTIAGLDSNVKSATKLETARKIWGQSFDGTSDISGDLLYVKNINARTNYGGYALYSGLEAGESARFDITDSNGVWLRHGWILLQNGNMGIGTISPTKKLDVNGSTGTTDLYINGIRLHKSQDGVIKLEGNLAVTGGVTQYAIDSVTLPTIMDGVAVDGTTIAKVNGVLKVLNAGGGEAGSVKWANIMNKPTTLAGYSITATDVLNTLKTVDGSGSGLDADTLDGVHLADIQKKVGYGWATIYKVNNWSRIMRIDGYSNILLSINFSQNSQASIHLYLISTGFEKANIVQLGANNFNINYGIKIRVTESSASVHYVEIYSSYGYNGATDISVECNYLKLDYNSTVTVYTAYTAGGDTVRKEITSSCNKIVSDLQGNADTATIADKLSVNAGSATNPIYFVNGIPVAGTYTFGNAGDNAAINNGILCRNLNADMLDGYHLKYDWSSNNKTCVKLFTIKISSAYVNTPVEFRINGRSGGDALISVRFDNYNGTDPRLISFTGYGIYSGYIDRLKIYKSATSTWEIWLTSQTQSYDSGQIYAVYVPGGFSFTVNGSTSTTLPTYSTSYTCSKASIYGNIAGNSSTATKLQTARTIWGQSFNGTANVSGNIIDTQAVKSKSGVWLDLHGANGVAFYTNNTVKAAITTSGNFGIGTTSPSQKLHVAGNILATGGGTFYSSDIRAKIIIERPKLSLNSIANAPVIKFRWNGYNGLKDNNKQHVGGIAQYIEKILPECVIGQKDDFLSFDYATVGYIFSVQTARHLQSYETKTDREIKKLKNRITFLEKQLKKLGYEEVDIMAD